jgi:hypothetical protein
MNFGKKVKQAVNSGVSSTRALYLYASGPQLLHKYRVSADASFHYSTKDEIFVLTV